MPCTGASTASSLDAKTSGPVAVLRTRRPNVRNGRVLLGTGAPTGHRAGAGQAGKNTGEKGVGHVGRNEAPEAGTLPSRLPGSVYPTLLGPSGAHVRVVPTPLMVAGRTGSGA